MVQLRRVLSNWGEGASDASGEEGSGAEAAPGDATWVHTFFDTTAWGTLGGDFLSTASGTALVGDFGSYGWSSGGMVADIQSWLNDPSRNFGWALIGNEGSNQTAKRFDSKDGGGPHPVLEVVYLP